MAPNYSKYRIRNASKFRPQTLQSQTFLRTKTRTEHEQTQTELKKLKTKKEYIFMVRYIPDGTTFFHSAKMSEFILKLNQF